MILAIDPTTHAGIAVYDPARNIARARDLEWCDDPARMTSELLPWIGAVPALVVIEDQHIGPNRRGAVIMAQIAGAQAWWARERWPGVTVVWLFADHARKLVGCPAKGKPAITGWVRSQVEGMHTDLPEPRHHNAHDALLLAMAGHALIEAQ